MPSGRPPSTRESRFNVDQFLKTAGLARRVVRFPSGAVVFRQGQAATAVFHVLEGQVKLSVLASTGKEAVIAVLGPGDFFGERCLAGEPARTGSATAVGAIRLLRIAKSEMIRALHRHRQLAERFISHMLARQIRMQEDVIDQLLNSCEKRLARTLLLLARYRDGETGSKQLPKISQDTLAEMVGTTRPHINFFMNKFRDLGLIDYNGVITVTSGLANVILGE